LKKDDFVKGCVISLRELRPWMAMEKWENEWTLMKIKGHPTPLGHSNNGWLWGNETMVKHGEMEQIINSRKNKISLVPLWKWNNEWIREIGHWMGMELNMKAKFHCPKFNISKSTHFSTFSILLVSSIFIYLLNFPTISKIFLHKLTFKKDDLVKNE
jgi:hypothetical protein